MRVARPLRRISSLDVAITAAVAALVLAVAFSSSLAIASLASISVSPRSGSANQSLKITYQGPAAGSGFSGVTAVLSWDGTNFAVLLLTAANSYKATISYSPPTGQNQVGNHRICGSESPTYAVACTTYTVVAVRATPRPTPKPTPKPTTAPTDSPEPSAVPSASVGPSPEPSPSASLFGVVSPSPGASSEATSIPAAPTSGAADWLPVVAAVLLIGGVASFLIVRSRSRH